MKWPLLPLRACLNCGSWIDVRTFFCSKCHNRCLTQFQNPSDVRVKNIQIKSLLRWPPGKSDVLSSLILQMKTEPEKSWSVWADEFLLAWEDTKSSIKRSKETVLISSESVSGKRHAQNWAQALSFRLGYPHNCLLRPQSQNKSQKELTKLERSNRAFDLSVEFSNYENKRIIFVDDVVTTGQTALGAYKALKEPTDFEVWCLIYREL